MAGPLRYGPGSSSRIRPGTHAGRRIDHWTALRYLFWERQQGVRFWNASRWRWRRQQVAVVEGQRLHRQRDAGQHPRVLPLQRRWSQHPPRQRFAWRPPDHPVRLLMRAVRDGNVAQTKTILATPWGSVLPQACRGTAARGRGLRTFGEPRVRRDPGHFLWRQDM